MVDVILAQLLPLLYDSQSSTYSQSHLRLVMPFTVGAIAEDSILFKVIMI